MRTLYFLIVVTLLIAPLSCKSSNTARPQADGPDSDVPKTSDQAVNVLTSDAMAREANDFGSYWNRGLAEVNRYDLEQLRYGEVHEGEFVGIFVTEPFLKDRQVKYEFGPREDVTKVLKLITHRRFYTGLYPYNIHSAVFVPVENGASVLKTSFSVTEWCGIVYAQLNKRDDTFDVQAHSYFQAEGDQDFDLPIVPLENELWVQLRKDPSSLPTGELDVVPDLTYLRLVHREIKPYRGVAKKIDATKTEFAEKPLAAYVIDYPSLGRTFELYYEEAFPHRIYGFVDKHSPIFERDPEASETRGKLTHSIMLDYWTKNAKSDAKYREALGLDI